MGNIERIYVDIIDFINFEYETSIIWPFKKTYDEIISDKSNLYRIAFKISKFDYQTDDIYDCLLERYGDVFVEDGKIIRAMKNNGTVNERD